MADPSAVLSAVNVAPHTPADYLGSLEVLRTYAMRVARRMLLRRCCEEGHPVLAIEEDLVQMARSRLQEFLLASYSPDDLAGVRPAVHQAVQRAASAWIVAADGDQDVKSSLLEQLDGLSEDDLVPSVH